MKKLYVFLLYLFFFNEVVSAQSKTDITKTDTVGLLAQVMIKGYLSNQRRLTVPASVAVLDTAQLKLQPDNSLISALNTVPGVRMEERSPGSYRLSIRGSLLRSPFGIRDVKIYFDELPLTDAGGNTYLNVIDFNSVQGVEILKGPDGSLFGANSGGVVLISPVSRYSDTSFLSVGYDGGSYALSHENVAYQYTKGNNQLNVNQAYESYGGYRQNSAMYRNYFQATDRVTYNANDNVKAIVFYSDLHYQTPGGLTLAQYDADPQEARIATAATPGAIQTQAAIGTRMWFGGAVNNYHITDNLRNVLAVYGSYVEFYNPFITDYETRYEGTYGLRTYFELTGQQHKNYNWQAYLGLEWQQTDADINNYGNNNGMRDTAQTLDKINTNQHFIFGRYSANFYKRLHVEAAVSLNYYDYEFKNLYPNNEQNYTNRPFTPQLMPRLALSYQITDYFAWRASVSRGYSTPTTAEIRPTDHTINTNLQAEYGWNYETGFRLKNNDGSMYADVSVFYYKLQNAIILHVNPDETDTYVNSGGTNQTGFELYYNWWIIRPNRSSFIRGLQFNESATIDKFTFSTTHNQLTGVPQQVYISSLQLKLPKQLYFFVEHNYTAKLPLNDANTVFAPYYNLLAAKAGWQHTCHRKAGGDDVVLEIYAGADNLLNEKYSLGDDLNAVGNRYYNAAPLRNYYVGLKVGI